MLPAIYAHRLGRDYGPDSSSSALSRALAQPLEGLETDCCLTGEGEFVLLHDPLLEACTTLSGWAHERQAAEIISGRLLHHDGRPSEEAPMLLDELLEKVDPSLVLQLEIKAHGDVALARRTARALCDRLRHAPRHEQIEIISFWTGACEVAARLGFRSRLVVIAEYQAPA